MPDQPHPYVPAGPLESAPSGGFQPAGVRREALAAVLEGVPLGAYDQRILEWLTGLDDDTCRAFASLMQRCRLAAPPGSVTEWALAYTHRPNLPGMPHRRVIQPYPDEEMAREAVAGVRRMEPGDEPALMRRQLTPWKTVPGGEGNDDRERRRHAVDCRGPRHRDPARDPGEHYPVMLCVHCKHPGGQHVLDGGCRLCPECPGWGDRPGVRGWWSDRMTDELLAAVEVSREAAPELPPKETGRA